MKLTKIQLTELIKKISKDLIKESIKPESYSEMTSWLHGAIASDPRDSRRLENWMYKGQIEDAAIWLKKTFPVAMKFWDVDEIEEFLAEEWDMGEDWEQSKEIEKTGYWTK